MESLHGLFQGETVGHEGFEVDEAAGNEADGFGVLWVRWGKECEIRQQGGEEEAGLLGGSSGTGIGDRFHLPSRS